MFQRRRLLSKMTVTHFSPNAYSYFWYSNKLAELTSKLCHGCRTLGFKGLPHLLLMRRTIGSNSVGRTRALRVCCSFSSFLWPAILVPVSEKRAVLMKRTIMLRHSQAGVTTETPKRGESMDRKRQLLILIVLSLAAVLVSSCASETATSNQQSPERKENADELLAKMTRTLNESSGISFTTSETADRPKRAGGMEKLNIDRQVAFRRPDRMY